ncbi:efflux RND transporter periplasmic adaptor subunit, partial [bacterium]|nr:efflux RND transporter periplasmic adaptor subunit [bacterium]
HLTDLRDFRPVDSGTLSISWMQQPVEMKTQHIKELAHRGIFIEELIPPDSGVYELVLSLNSTKVSGKIVVPSVSVYASESEIPHEHEDSDDDETVSFLKEQQWQFDFRTETAARRILHNTIRALGEINPAGVGQAEVFAPFDAILLPDPQHGIVHPGQRVSKGDVLARLAPSGGAESGWNQLLNDYRLAKAEYERVMRLNDMSAVPVRRLQEAKLDLENKEARLRGALGWGDSEIDDERFIDGEHFHLRAPADGILTDIHLSYGQHVQTGEHLFDIVNPSKIWLEARVPVSESSHIDQINDAYFTVSGSDRILRISDFDGRLVTASALLDPQTRRIPVIFELQNKENFLRPGSFAQVYLKTSASRKAVAIPESAILDEDGTPVAYVQLQGENFEKRILKTGIKDEGYIEVLSGISEGERVVTKGAYKVRLAALKSSLEGAGGHAGHGH